MTRQGDPVGVPCPHCGTELIYNGTYFCPTGDWAASDRWLARHPEAYANLFDYRGERAKTEHPNFDQALYDRGVAARQPKEDD